MIICQLIFSNQNKEPFYLKVLFLWDKVKTQMFEVQTQSEKRTIIHENSKTVIYQQNSMIICQLGIIFNENKETFYLKIFEVQRKSEKKMNTK